MNATHRPEVLSFLSRRGDLIRFLPGNSNVLEISTPLAQAEAVVLDPYAASNCTPVYVTGEDALAIGAALRRLDRKLYDVVIILPDVAEIGQVIPLALNWVRNGGWIGCAAAVPTSFFRERSLALGLDEAHLMPWNIGGEGSYWTARKPKPANVGVR